MNPPIMGATEDLRVSVPNNLYRVSAVFEYNSVYSCYLSLRIVLENVGLRSWQYGLSAARSEQK